ncbi:hypothetical protein [Frankia sp. ACN1ag]|uniref:hypothetical protein n=1 Tax=Frankia sp. ACN1ag TaxID=102891 RepID=UPI0006DC6C15|nr:hypothetical protein [Frankia sp. ACN1ag]KQC38468.1 hypothetical protein UK82_10645 [Frankia sp. ACN1ag]
MSTATGPVATLDLRSGCRRRVARRPWAPGTLRTLLTRRPRFDVGAAERLLIVDEARTAAAHQAGLAALTTGRPAESVLLVLVGPVPGEITAPGTHGAPAPADTSADPWRGTGAQDEGAQDELFGAVPGDETLPDLDAPYNPAFYAFVDDTAFVDDGSLGDDAPEGSARPTAAAASAAPGSAPTIPAILWVGAVEGRPSAAAVDSAGPALRVLLDALRSPEVFDEVTRAVSAMPGCLAFPGIRAVVGRLPGELLRGLQIGATSWSDAPTDAAVVPELAGEGRLALLDPSSDAATIIAFAPRVARPEPPPPETDGAGPADPVGPTIEIVWTAATMLAGVLRLTPARDADVLGVLFPGLRP